MKHTHFSIELIKEMDDYLCYYDLYSSDFDHLIRQYPDDDYLLGIKYATMVSEGFAVKIAELLSEDIGQLGTFQLYALGLAWEWQKNMDKALYYFLKSIEKDTYHANIWSRIRAAIINFDLKNEDIALNYITTALALNPTHPAALLEKAEMLIRLKQDEAFIEIIKKIPRSYKPAITYQFKAEYFINKTDFENAQIFYEKSLFFDYNHIESHLGIIHIYLEQKNYEEAKKYLLQCLEDFSQDDQLMFEYAMLLRYHSDYKAMNENVIEQFIKDAIDIVPDERYLAELVYFYLDGYNNNYQSLIELLQTHNEPQSFILEAHIILILFYYGLTQDAKSKLEKYVGTYGEVEKDYLHDLLQDYELF